MIGTSPPTRPPTGTHTVRLPPLTHPPLPNPDINNQMFKETGTYPMNLYAAIRWLGHSDCPLSGAYGQPGDRFVLIEASSAHGTPGWESFCQQVLAKFASIRNKKDGSLPKPHWGKVNKGTSFSSFSHSPTVLSLSSSHSATHLLSSRPTHAPTPPPTQTGPPALGSTPRT